ncbi:hypothetical protein [Parvularcula dongshanensis]|uniref:Uncharacterized protein n=1 Tax=Parvularcula dongshanensis TaxID=1173995 RepID=A0A840I667_9PROT|nr:hypothetical protein [Parvularcula dongshanensis]MBB4660327.1 hypothetical protein [Parvularcula dongshanensis]
MRILALLILLACAPAEEGSAAAVLTPGGFGPLTIGMPATEVALAVGGPPGTMRRDVSASCEAYHPEGLPEGMSVMIENQRLTRITLTAPSAVETEDGFKVGDDGDAVEAALPDAAVTPHKYEAAPSRYVTIWASGDTEAPYVTDEDGRGIRYVVDGSGKVAAIDAGGPSIQLVEGCL